MLRAFIFLRQQDWQESDGRNKDQHSCQKSILKVCENTGLGSCRTNDCGVGHLAAHLHAQYPIHVSSPVPLNLNNLLTKCVSHPLILFKACCRLDPPYACKRYVFAPVKLGGSVPCPVCFLHSFFQTYKRYSRRLKLFSNGVSCCPVSFPPSCPH